MSYSSWVRMVAWIVFIIGIVFLAYTLAFPDRWARLVDAENDFWVRHGLVSRKVSDHFRRFEKGVGLKVLVFIGILGGGGALYFRYLAGPG